MLTNEERAANWAVCDAATPNPVRYYVDGEPYVQIGGMELRKHPVVEKLAEYDRHEKLVLPALIADRDHWKARAEANEAAKRTLEQKGYTYHGGELWKPPLGKTPDFGMADRWKAKCEARERAILDVSDIKELLELATCHSCIFNSTAHNGEPCNSCLESAHFPSWKFDEARFSGSV